jgi:uncharacterized protein YccT (UPF0319 family)
MNFLRVIVIGISLFTGLPALATTLQLPQAMELLIVDGTPVNSILLRGAGSLELAQGGHQLVFTLNRRAYHDYDRLGIYRPFYLIVLFDTWNAHRLRFRLPPLTTRDEIDHFISLPVVTLLDEHDAAVNAAYSRLPVGNEGVMAALRHHEREYGATLPMPPRLPAPNESPAADAWIASPLQNSTAAHIEQMLRFWFLPSGSSTRPQWLD